MVNRSQHPLQDPIDKGRSVFKQSPGIIGIEVYVQWAILCFAPGLSAATVEVSDDYIVDVYGMYFNWLAIKDGRALTSFA